MARGSVAPLDRREGVSRSRARRGGALHPGRAERPRQWAPPSQIVPEEFHRQVRSQTLRTLTVACLP